MAFVMHRIRTAGAVSCSSIVAKIVSSVISFRLQNVLEQVGCEYQNGFTSQR